MCENICIYVYICKHIQRSAYLDMIYVKEYMCMYIYIYIYIYTNVYIVHAFTTSPRDLDSIPGRVIPKTLKWILDTSLLTTQQYLVRIKGKVEQSRERKSSYPYR